MKINANPLLDASDERLVRQSQIVARRRSLQLQAMEARRDAIAFEDKLTSARKSAATEERRRERLVLSEKLRDPAWWAGQIFRPKRILLALLVGFIWWLTTLG